MFTVICYFQLQYQAMGLFDSFEEDTPHSPSNIVPAINVEELFDDPKYVSSTAIQVCIIFSMHDVPHPRLHGTIYTCR